MGEKASLVFVDNLWLLKIDQSAMETKQQGFDMLTTSAEGVPATRAEHKFSNTWDRASPLDIYVLPLADCPT